MKSYTITIAPDEPPGATAVIQVAVDEAGPLLKRFSLVAAEGQILSAAELSKFDTERLVSTLLPAAILMSGAGQRADDSSTGGEAGSPPPPSAPAPEPARVSRRRPTAAGHGEVVAMKEPVKPKHVARRTTNGAKATSAAVGESRNYRLMPDDFFDKFGKNTMAELAEEYEVPLYTIQSWISTARRHGKLPPARKRRARA
jgi:hypothetical protein